MVRVQLEEVKILIWRWLILILVLLATLWTGQLAVGYMWAAGSPARPDFNPKPYLHLAGVTLSLFGALFISFIVLCVMNVRKLFKKKKS